MTLVQNDPRHWCATGICFITSARVLLFFTFTLGLSPTLHLPKQLIHTFFPVFVFLQFCFAPFQETLGWVGFTEASCMFLCCVSNSQSIVICLAWRVLIWLHVHGWVYYYKAISVNARFPCSVIYCTTCEVAFVSHELMDECVCVCLQMIWLSISNAMWIMPAFFLPSLNKEVILRSQECGKD